MTAFTIDVRDEKNPERLLGRLVERPVRELHCYLEVAVIYPVSARAYDFDFDHSKPVAMPPRARFRVSYRTDDGGYSKRAELLTDTPLGVLQMIHSFRLPGETERQADNRRALSIY